MKILLCLFFIPVGLTYSQNCPNLNFSANNFNNWSGTTGTVPNNGGTPYDVPGFVIGQHQILNTPGLDPNTGNILSYPPPGSTSVCMLGNNIPGYGAESMSYLITVDQSNRLFIYEYAMVLQAPGHSVNEEPRFIVKITDLNGNLLPGECSYYETYGSDPNNNFTNLAGIAFSTWQKVAIDLSQYNGQTLKIQFTTLDCGLGGHYGYAYLTASCGPLELTIQKNCEGSIVLSAPDGFHSYMWSPGGEATQSITLQNPPTGIYSYSCTMNPIAGLSCPTPLDTTFSFIQTPTFSTIDTAICFGESVTLSTVNNEVGGPYLWLPGGQNTPSITVTPDTNSTYYVTYSALNNCDYIDTASVTVYPLPILYLNDVIVCDGSSAILNPYPVQYDYVWENGYYSNTPFLPETPQYYTVTATDPLTGCKQTDSLFIDIKPLPSASFSYVCGSIPAEFFNESIGGIINYWNFGDGSPIQVGNHVFHPYVDLSVDYYNVNLTTESVYGCKDSIQIQFPIPLIYYVPNTFTPDGDTYNNVFKPIFSHNNKVGNFLFQIFNRWGDLIFESQNIYIGWDGTFGANGIECQDNTFTWKLIYRDTSCNDGLKEIIGHVNLIK